jgi:hypothetical protein
MPFAKPGYLAQIARNLSAGIGKYPSGELFFENILHSLSGMGAERRSSSRKADVDLVCGQRTFGGREHEDYTLDCGIGSSGRAA